MEQLIELQEKIGYQFKDIKLLKQALTHSSYANEKHLKPHSDNERLEFLGDAVLEIFVSNTLYFKYPDENEGKLTRMRASVVCELSLALACKSIELGKYLYLSKGEDRTGGRNRASIVSDAFEALAGAIYLDGGYDEAATFLWKLIPQDIEMVQLFHESKTKLQEIVQGRNLGKLHYETIGVEGPDHNRNYKIQVFIDDTAYCEGEGHSKKEAEQHAAFATIKQLEKEMGK